MGCRRIAPSSELVRIFHGVDPEGVRGPGLGVGAGPGRGAWLCRNHPVECLDKASKRRAVARALRAEVPGGDIERLRAKLVSTEAK